MGFTRGIQDPHEPTLWRVTGRQAHAWAEVYFQGLGWVTFDPTPGRGPSDAPNWLPGVTPEQAVPGGTEVDASTPATDPANPAPSQDPGQPGNDVDTGSALPPGEEPTPPEEEDEDSSFYPDTVLNLAKWGGIAVLAYVVLAPAALFGMLALRRARARTPAAKVDLGWREATERAAEAGVGLHASLTVAERSARMRSALPAVAPEVDVVAQWVEQVNYAEVAPSPEQAAAVTRASAAIVAAAASRQPWYVRVLRYLDVRRLFPQPDRARRTAHGAVRTA